jgi:hypothetical protein
MLAISAAVVIMLIVTDILTIIDLFLMHSFKKILGKRCDLRSLQRKGVKGAESRRFSEVGLSF